MDEQMAEDSLFQALQANPLFQSLRPAEVQEFARLALERRCAGEEVLVWYGDDWPYLFLVAEGKIAARKESGEGRSLQVAEFGRGEIFWGLAFFHEEAANLVTLQAAEPSRLYLWSRAQAAPFIARHGALAWELCRLMAERMIHASGMLEGLAFQPVTRRLARLLLEQYPADQQAVERSLTLEEMAARIGTTREVVCRILYRFAAQGAIQINRTEFIFKDRELLENY